MSFNVTTNHNVLSSLGDSKRRCPRPRKKRTRQYLNHTSAWIIRVEKTEEEIVQTVASRTQRESHPVKVAGIAELDNTSGDGRDKSCQSSRQGPNAQVHEVDAHEKFAGLRTRPKLGSNYSRLPYKLSSCHSYLLFWGWGIRLSRFLRRAL